MGMLRGFLVVAVGVLALAPEAGAQQPTVRFGERTAVPQLPCRPGDRPETGLQGRVPREDLLSGRAALGYQCNLALVGQLPGSSGGTLDASDDCAYFGVGAGAGVTLGVDVSQAWRPLPTATLLTRAMVNPWESMRVNAKRKLLVADSTTSPYLDIYDVSGDCRHPRLISSTDMSPAWGHEGWFSPDGMTYYMSTTGIGLPTLFPVDISDPAHPKRLGSWQLDYQTHGGSTSEDGTRSYVCLQGPPPNDALEILDTSQIAERVPGAQPRVITKIPLEDNQWCQGAYRVTYDGHPFLIQYGERSGAADCSRAGDNWASFGYPRIFDLADEKHPKLVSSALLEVSLPQHCAEVTGEGAINGLGYSVHHCSPDRLYNPTILACGWFFSGLRVLDIRDPYHPVEIGYYNPGIGAIVGVGARPVVRAERGEIWFVNDVGGFYVVRFEDGLWPFEDAASCPEFDDYYYAQYNPGSKCPTANLDGIGKPAPGGGTAARAAARLTMRIARRPHARFRITGRLVRPARVPARAGCRGQVQLTVRRGGRTVATVRTRVVRSCRYALSVKVPAARRLAFTARFSGNARLAPTKKRVVAAVHDLRGHGGRRPLARGAGWPG